MAIIRPSDISSDYAKALAGVLSASKDLGVSCVTKASSMWAVRIDDADREAFIELAKEAGERFFSKGTGT